MIKIQRSTPAPKSLAIEAQKTNGTYGSLDVVQSLKKRFS